MSISVVTTIVAPHYVDQEEELAAPRIFVGVFWAIIFDIVFAGLAAGAWLTIHRFLSR